MRVNACRSCGAPSPRSFLSLGETPLADALIRHEDERPKERRFPLDVGFCPNCSLVQLLYELPPRVLFVDNYLYFSSYSEDVLEHSREHARRLHETRRLGPSSLVVEVASNDGYLLRNFADLGVPVLGIDPAPDQAAAARAAGVPTVEEFFGVDLARKLSAEGRQADVIIANNVLAHVPDLNGFVAGLRLLVKDDGLITIENPYVRDLIEHCEFDTIYHEHLMYYSCTSLSTLMERHGLYLNDVEYFPRLHGGTLRWHVSPRRQSTERVGEYLDAERATGLDHFGYYDAFGDRVTSLREDLRQLLWTLKGDGARISAYGAAAKGATLLNYCGIDKRLIDFVVDRNPHKQGMLMPGVGIPIRAPEALLEERPDYVLMLAWNFRDEILRQQSDYLALGGRFIVPVPTPEVVSEQVLSAVVS